MALAKGVANLVNSNFWNFYTIFTASPSVSTNFIQIFGVYITNVSGGPITIEISLLESGDSQTLSTLPRIYSGVTLAAGNTLEITDIKWILQNGQKIVISSANTYNSNQIEYNVIYHEITF